MGGKDLIRGVGDRGISHWHSLSREKQDYLAGRRGPAKRQDGAGETALWGLIITNIITHVYENVHKETCFIAAEPKIIIFKKPSLNRI